MTLGYDLLGGKLDKLAAVGLSNADIQLGPQVLNFLSGKLPLRLEHGHAGVDGILRRLVTAFLDLLVIANIGIGVPGNGGTLRK